MKSKILILAPVLVALLIGVALYLRSNNRPVADNSITHTSQFFKDAGYINDNIDKFKNSDKVGLDNTLGGVVPHHIPNAIPLLAEFYVQLQKTRNVDTFIIIGPDHFEKGRADVSISKAEFVTPFGKLSPNLEIISELEKAGLVVNDETPFDDHSIHSQLLFISRLFPSAKVVPIVFRSSSTNEFAELLGEKLASLATPNTFIIASVDFSHYLNKDQALPLDERSASMLTLLQPKLAGLIEADSPQSLVATIAAVKALGADISIPLGTYNSADYSNIQDFTTGYVVQFFGKKKQESSKARDGTMIFVGDIMLSRSVGELMAKKGDYNLPFLNIRDFLKGADLTFGNLENPVSSRGTRVGSIYSFRADPRVVEGLKFAGFDVLSIANNHIWDYGRDAFLDTLKHLKDSGINYVGGGVNSDEAHAGIIKDINGTKIGFLAYTDLLSRNLSATLTAPGISFLELEQVKKDIAALRSRVDILVVSFHWGDEYQTKHNSKQEYIAKIAIDSGADLIIGHHPHVVQEVEQYKNSWIAYSLGNFVFDQMFSKETMQGAILQVSLKDGKLNDVKEILADINNNYQPDTKD